MYNDESLFVPKLIAICLSMLHRISLSGGQRDDMIDFEDGCKVPHISGGHVIGMAFFFYMKIYI
jgi:hypothetical protein